MQSRVVWELCRVGSRWGARCGETLLGGRRCSGGGHRLPPCSSFSSPPSSAPKPSRKTTSVSYILFLFFKYAFTGLRRFVYTGSHISLALPFSVVCVSFSPAFTICIKLPSRHYIYQQHFFFCFDEFITADAFDMLTFYFLPFFHLFSTDTWLAHFECITLFCRYITHTMISPYDVSLISFMQLWCIYIFTSILVYSLSNPNNFLTNPFTLL